jgi:hypothetical protein
MMNKKKLRIEKLRGPEKAHSRAKAEVIISRSVGGYSSCEWTRPSRFSWVIFGQRELPFRILQSRVGVPTTQ